MKSVQSSMPSRHSPFRDPRLSSEKNYESVSTEVRRLSSNERFLRVRRFDQLTSRRSIFGMPGVVSLIAHLMITFGRTPREADWTKLAEAWRDQLDVRIEQLERLRDDLTTCIGCGCLSFERCKLVNPADRLSAEGSGARRFAAGTPRSEPVVGSK